MTNNQMIQQGKKKRGELIAVCSAKGGIGRTTLTVNLAVALFKKNISISIVDGDFQFGDISLAMDLQSTFTIKDVVEEIDRLDEFSLASYLCNHETGVKVLPAPERPEYAEIVTEEILSKVLDLLLVQQDYVLVDTGVGLQEKTLQFIEKADQVLVVTNLEMAALKNTKLMLETLEVLGMREKVRVVVNRATMESVIQASDVPEILGEDDPVYIPNDFQIASQSLNIGIPFVMNQGKTELAKSVFKMAEQLTTRREISMIKAKKPSIISKFLNRKRLKEETAE
ncbi:AAA family ATPase [Bacillus luteolus]|uniref:AAA family ATPase n=1 Tax=Litchfieldia luteola TaxID=682179 RepID=A0ABR9QLD0_9BACI|nr:AAA family ATPase [Cytobacillus luteolus]MBE4909298.1 AAA family ATPase [Cytobacillus luteolus]MBP1940692.1 pilus assembly protein CpaE [Cytobacillus luteolus]